MDVASYSLVAYQLNCEVKDHEHLSLKKEKKKEKMKERNITKYL